MEQTEANHEALTDETHGASGVGGAVEHLADAPERSLLDAAEASQRKGVPLRIRALLQLRNPESESYKGWRGQAWTVATSGVVEARAVQEVIEIAFDLMAMRGAEQTRDLLAELKGKLLENPGMVAGSGK